MDLSFGDIDVLAIGFLLSGLIIGSTGVFLYVNSGNISPDRAGEDLVSTLERQSGQNLELVNVKKENGLYRVQVKDSQDQLSTYYMTENGKMAATQMVDLPQLNAVLDAEKKFTQCMTDKNVKLYGNQSQRATLLQIQVMNQVSDVSTYYSDVNREGVLEEALNNGVESVPAFYMDGEVLSGPAGLQGVQNFTGCTYEIDNSTLG